MKQDDERPLRQMHSPATVGEILRDVHLKPLKLTQKQLAEHLGVSRATVNRLIQGRTRITVDIAQRLARAFRTSVQFWLNIQYGQDEWEARQQMKPEIRAIKPIAQTDGIRI